MTPEGEVKKLCRAYLKSVPGLWFTTTQNMGYGKSGVPDDLVCYRGRFVALEYKKLGGTATPWQRREIAAIIDSGGIAEVVWTVEQCRTIVERINDACR